MNRSLEAQLIVSEDESTRSISTGWSKRLLGEFTTNFDSMRVPVREADRQPGPYPYYGASGVVDHIDSFLFDGEYLLIAEDGENLRTRKTPVAFLATGQFWVNNHAHVVQANDSSSTKFLHYALSNTDFRGFLTGSTMPKLTKDSLNRIPILLPPKNVQETIAHILGTLDDKIELNRRLNRTLEEMARALFTSWFVTFDPVRANAAGRQPVGMDAATAALFPSVLHETNLGEIPGGWVAGTVGDLVSIARQTVNPSRYPDEVFHHYSIPAFDAGQRPVVEQGLAIKSNKTFVEAGSVLVSKLNPHIPRIWFPNLGLAQRSLCSTEFLVVVPKRQVVRQPFIYSLLTSEPYYQAFASRVTGTTGSHQRVPSESLLAVGAVVPPDDVIARFQALTSPIFDSVLERRRESDSLAKARDLLLPQLLSGKRSALQAEASVV